MIISCHVNVRLIDAVEIIMENIIIMERLHENKKEEEWKEWIADIFLEIFYLLENYTKAIGSAENLSRSHGTLEVYNQQKQQGIYYPIQS